MGQRTERAGRRKLPLWKILPKMALTGVIKNGTVYYPYIGTGIFSVFTWFVFSSIHHNDLIATLPNSAYAWILLAIGKVLLSIILLLFLFYTNSFLIKRRKREIGLYSILGLEKKHIGFMMTAEAVLLYVIILAGGIVSGVVLSRLLFLLLLRLTGLPVDAKFVFYPVAFKETLIYFLVVYGINLIFNLIEIGRARPVELMSAGKKGEKEPKLLWIYALLGLAALLWGYATAVRSKIDSMIFTNFFLAVFLVIVGTYLLFTSGSLAFFKLLKKKKKVYYKPANFVTISGMLYRMKKNAASLSNICIFSTMVIITLVCTASLYLGMDGILAFNYPYDVNIYFQGRKPAADFLDTEIEKLEAEYGVKVEKADVYDRIKLSCGKDGERFGIKFEQETDSRKNEKVILLTLEDYNRMEGQEKTLGADEALLLSTGEDYGFSSLTLMDKKFRIKEELQDMYAFPKDGKININRDFCLIVKDRTVLEDCARAFAAANGVEDMEEFSANDSRVFNLTLSGERADKEAFIAALLKACRTKEGFVAFYDNLESGMSLVSMYGGLLFIGILFSLIFLMCLILIMYYKQISEGYEDKESFAVMQKVGMSDREIKATIRRQILMVFFLPLAGAVLHTSAGMFMVSRLLGTLHLFNTPLITACALGVTALFIILYGASYMLTAKTYYGIVRQREQ